MMRANRSTLAKLCLLTALAVPVQRAASATAQVAKPATGSSAESVQLVAQAEGTAPSFTPPASLAGAETLRIDGSSSMRAMNEALGEQFKARYPDATVESETSGTDAAVEKLIGGDIDLAAIGRPLTQAEKDAGLVAVPIAREKIAIFVSPENPFSGDITFEQFGKIFRGEITDWSEVGGEPGPIRFIDRPESSDTRQAFRSYPVFQSAPFTTGATAAPVAEDETEAVISALGENGVGYGIANQVMGNENAKIVPMHKTLPDDPRYPFSQPRSYVYKGEPTPAVQGFLAVATSPEGTETVEAVRDTESAAAAQIEGPGATATSPDGSLKARTDENNVAILEDASGNLVAGPLAGAGGAVTALAFSQDGQTLATGSNTGKIRLWGVNGEPKGDIFDTGYGKAITELEFRDNDQIFAAVEGRSGLWDVKDGLYSATGQAGGEAASSAGSAEAGGRFPWWWLLIPLVGLLGAGLWLLGRRRDPETAVAMRQTSPTATVPPPATDPNTEREVSSRAQTVISTDRVTDESRTLAPEPAVEPLPAPSTMGAEITDEQPSTLYESTDLESPELEGTNLDLMTPGAVAGAAALGGMAIAAGGPESDLGDDEEDVWDDNLDLSLEEPEASPTLPTDTGPAEQPSPASLETFDSTFEGVEPTRDTVIAETENVPDIEPTRETIISDGTVIFGGAAAASLAASEAAASQHPEPAETGTGTTGTAKDATSPIGLGAAAVGADTEEDINLSAPDTYGNENESPDDFFELSPASPTPAAATPPTIAAAAMAAGAMASIPLAGGAQAEDPWASESMSDSREQFEPPTFSEPVEPPSYSTEELAAVDEGLQDLPDGYGESRIVLLPRDPKWAYAYWDVSNEHKEDLRRQGGQRLMLRLYDVTDIDQSWQTPHSMQQHDCHEMARSWYLEIPVSDRDYTVEIGYLTGDDRWLMLARSAPVRVPPIYPSDWVKDQFVTICFDESLAGRTFGDLGRPGLRGDRELGDLPPIYAELFALTQGQDAMRVAGSLFGSMHQIPPGALSVSGMASGIGLNVSGLTMSGIGMGSGASVMPGRSRKFWLVADAELIVYGATEPDATLTVGDRIVPLNPDGTFRFHVSFPDGQIDYPIRAVAADGEQSRSIAMHFERQTPERQTNTKEEAKDEWF